MPIFDTRKYKELEGMGQLVSDLVLTLLSDGIRRKDKNQNSSTSIEIVKSQSSGKKRYHTGATGQDKLVCNKIVELLESGMSMRDIHVKVEVVRKTI